MNKLRERLVRFMRGRYGYDDLNYWLFAASMIFNMIGLLLNSRFFSLAAFVLLILLISRAMSKNVIRRAEENRSFRKHTLVPRRFTKCLWLGMKDKNHRYYLCPSCHQICRVPKGAGDVNVHCPSCGTSFSKKA